MLLRGAVEFRPVPALFRFCRGLAAHAQARPGYVMARDLPKVASRSRNYPQAYKDWKISQAALNGDLDSSDSLSK